MRLKAIAACLYIGFVYYLAAHVPAIHPIFFPTLGAFAYLFIHRKSSMTEIGAIAVGAVVSSFVGSVLAQFHPSAVFFVANALFTFWLIHFRKWHAPPIMAVSFIPFFTHVRDVWTLPVSVLAALLGLAITLAAAAAVGKGWASAAWTFPLRKSDIDRSV